MARDPAARAAQSEFHLGDLWRRRLDARAHPRHPCPRAEGDQAEARRASHLRRRDQGGDRRDRSATIGTWACAISWRCAAIQPAAWASPTSPTPGGYVNAADLTAGIKKIAPFEVSVACYPEKHPESPSVDADIDMLWAKIDAGATRAITQFFFDNEVFFRFLDRVRARGITIPIVPGLIPIHNFQQVAGFATRSGASVPEWLGHRFEGLEHDQETRHLVAAAVAAEQVMGLVDQGITEFHFYTLNRADLVYAICHLLGLRPAAATAKVEAAQ